MIHLVRLFNFASLVLLGVKNADTLDVAWIGNCDYCSPPGHSCYNTDPDLSPFECYCDHSGKPCAESAPCSAICPNVARCTTPKTCVCPDERNCTSVPIPSKATCKGSDMVDNSIPVKDPCKRCPRNCRRKVTIGTAFQTFLIGGLSIKPGMCLDPDFIATYQKGKKDCNVLKVKRKKKKEFCLHSFLLRLAGKCKTVKVKVTGKNSEGKYTKTAKLCKDVTGFYQIPQSSGIFHLKHKTLDIEVCPKECKIMDWVMCACIENLPQ